MLHSERQAQGRSSRVASREPLATGSCLSHLTGRVAYPGSRKNEVATSLDVFPLCWTVGKAVRGEDVVAVGTQLRTNVRSSYLPEVLVVVVGVVVAFADFVVVAAVEPVVTSCRPNVVISAAE